MQQQINAGGSKPAKGNEKNLLRKIPLKLVAQLKSMGLTEFKDKIQFLVTAPVMAIIIYFNQSTQQNLPRTSSF